MLLHRMGKTDTAATVISLQQEGQWQHIDAARKMRTGKPNIGDASLVEHLQIQLHSETQIHFQMQIRNTNANTCTKTNTHTSTNAIMNTKT